MQFVEVFGANISIVFAAKNPSFHECYSISLSFCCLISENEGQ